MLKLLFKLFKKQFLKLAFDQQSKPVGFDKLQFSFIDSIGVKYSRFLDDLQMPLPRKLEIERLILELQAGISKNELQLFLEAMKDALSQTDKKGNFRPDIARIGFLVNEMKDRETMLIHPDTIMELLCAVSIREDENPGVWDEEIHRQKLKQLKKDCGDGGGLHDFFQQSSLTELMPYLDTSREKFSEYMRLGKVKVEALQKTLDHFKQRSSSPSGTK